MFYVLQNESVAARRRVPILLTDAATGTTAQAGVALTAIYAYVNSNGGAFSGGAGTVANSGFGQYYYEFDPAEIGTLGLAGIHVTALACRDYDAIVQVAALDFYSASSGASSYAIAQEVWNFDISEFDSNAGGYILNINENVNDVESNTNNIPLQVWGDDLAAGANSPYAAGTAGTILYTLGQAGVALTSGDVWSYVDRTITGGAVTSVTDPVSLATSSMAGIANSVWSTLTAPYTTHATFGHQVLRSDNAATIGEVTLHQSGGSKRVDADVHAFVNNTASATAILNILTGIGSSITGNITGNLSGSVGSVVDPVNVSTASMTGIAGTVWSTDISGYTSPSAGFDLANASSGSGLSAYNVWDFVITGFGQTGSAAVALSGAYSESANTYTQLINFTPNDIWTYAGIEGRTITGGAVSSVLDPVIFSSSQYSAIASSVWNAGTRTITGGIADTVSNVTGNVSGSVGSVLGNVSGNVVGSVGSVTGNVAGSVNSVVSGVTVTTNNDKTGYALSANQTFNVTGNVSGNILGTVNSVTGNVDGNVVGSVGSVTGNVSGSVGSVTADVNVSTSSMTGIAGTVWSYATRTLTSGGSGISAADVWTYGSRTITGGLADTVSNVTGNVSGSVGSVLGNVSGNVVGSVASVTGNVAGSVNSVVSDVPINEALISADVWTYATRTLTSGAGISAADVWNYSTRTVTGGTIDNATVSNIGSTAVAGIATSIWKYDIDSAIPVYNSGDAGFLIQYPGVQVWSQTLSNLLSAEQNLVNAEAGVGLTVGDIWSAPSRTITGGIADTVSNVTGNVSGSVGSVLGNVSGNVVGSVGSVTGNVSGNVVGSVASVTGNVAGSVGSVTGNVSGNVIGSVGSVTGNVSGNVVGSVGSVTGNVSGTVAAVTGNVSGNVVGSVASVLGNVSGNVVGTVGSVTGNVSGNVVGSVASVLGNVSGNVVGSVGSVTGNVAGSVAAVTGNVSGNVIGSVASVTGNVAGSVASVTSPVTFSSAQYASIASSVWNAATRTLTSGGSGISAADVWTYATRTLTSGGAGISAYDVWNFVLSDANTAEVDLVQAASGAGLTAGDVWTYGSREITGGLADTVTSITNPVTVGTNNDKTGYALSAGGVTAVQSGLSTLTQAQVGTEVDSSLSDVGLTSTVTGRIDVAVSSRLASSSYETPPTAASIASSVWSAGSRTITGGTVDNLTNPATVATSSMTGIAGTVWNYSTRTITAGGGATAGDVWTYPTRSLTSGAGITVNAATNIINGPYFVKSNVDGQDGNLDVITGMVQDIQLTVTDAFGNPFDTTALGLAVNFYNQAGTLTTSYGTSELYGPAGLVQFTLDTAVTGVEGRYNLILSAAGAGNTIKFGPLTTLVRPY
jgi:uncharacterized protein YjbJ (UPF0337 family)